MISNKSIIFMKNVTTNYNYKAVQHSSLRVNLNNLNEHEDNFS